MVKNAKKCQNILIPLTFSNPDLSQLFSFLCFFLWHIDLCWTNSRPQALQWLWLSTRPPFCGAGISSGLWHTAPAHILQLVINWVNNKWKLRARDHSLSVWQGAPGECRGSASFSARCPKSTLWLTYHHQHADCKIREEMEVDGVKIKKINKKREREKVSQVWLYQFWGPTCLHLFIWLDIISYL